MEAISGRKTINEIDDYQEGQNLLEAFTTLALILIGELIPGFLIVHQSMPYH